MEKLDTRLRAETIPSDPVFLYEGDDCYVVRSGSSVELTLKGGWKPSCAQLARKFGVESLDASRIRGWRDDSIAFLDELPGLRSVVIGAPHKLDWQPLERQTDLESVRLYSDVADQNNVDFTRLHGLRKCAIKWIPQFDSFRHCPWLKTLELFSSDSLRDLDLRELTDLEELNLNSCAQLGRVELAEQTRIRSLRVSNCPKLQLDLKRFVRDLEDLWLQGKVACPLVDLALAKHLKRLAFTFVKTKGRPAVYGAIALPNRRGCGGHAPQRTGPADYEYIRRAAKKGTGGTEKERSGRDVERRITECSTTVASRWKRCKTWQAQGGSSQMRGLSGVRRDLRRVISSSMSSVASLSSSSCRISSSREIANFKCRSRWSEGQIKW